MAERCDLMMHHGGHSSVMTGLAGGNSCRNYSHEHLARDNARRVRR
jgi:hypothetical protein